ncbi:hypothetical protein E6C60_2936 [Paenibacillus algicola]|uniref:Uncharacterized protein n=1 Tax=Paenibacillus algicola TaxID=2565926 RepID=A0A4P8XLJ1_9BACL|nr:hypothetical protein E6C60_2936 [Paenibacillus algicola]
MLFATLFYTPLHRFHLILSKEMKNLLRLIVIIYRYIAILKGTL